MNNQIYDIIVLGAGPTGLFSTFYANYMKLKCICIEISDNIGGQVTNLYPNKDIYDYPGFKKIKSSELIKKLYEQIKMHNGNIILNTSILKYEFLENEDCFKLYDQNNNIYFSKNILITIGIGGFEPNKLDGFPQTFHNKKVQYHINTNIDHSNKNILVFGGGNSAVDIANQLKTQYNANVSIIHRRDELKAHSFTIDVLKNHGIKIYLNTSLNEWNEQYCIFSNDVDQNFKIFYDYIIVQYGLKHIESPVHYWKDIIVENKKIVVDHNYETNIKKIYAAGDCINNENRINSIVSGIAEATIIINRIKKNINN